MDAPRRERRHHRKAAAAAAVGAGGAAAAVYGDVFGGPPRFAAPFGGPSPPPLDYAEVFGGVAATCSIPYLDLPPVVGGGADLFACNSGAGDYGEIFGRFDFGDFAVPYEELFGAPPLPEEVASPSGSSRSSIRKESSQLDAEPLHQHFKEHESSSISLPLDGHEFVMSYFKSTQARPDDIVEMSTYTGSSTDYVVGSCNFSHIPATNHVSKMDNGAMANGDKGKKSSSTFVSANVGSPESDIIVNQKQHISAPTPLSGNVSANENNQKSDSHATTGSAKPFTDYAFMRVSDVNVQTQLKMPLPPSGQESKVLKKRESGAKGDEHRTNHSCSPTSSVHATLSNNMPLAERETSAALSNTEANPNSAAAAMKEAMEYADARLRAAKELMERKGDSFKIRKKPSHHRSTRSTEIKASVEVDTFEEKLSVKKLAKEEKKNDNSMLDKHQTQISAFKSDHCDDNEKRVLPLEKPQQMVQPCAAPCETSNILEELGNWKSGDEFYELSGEDHKCKTDTTTGEKDYRERSKPVTKSSNGQKGRIETAADSEFGRSENLQEVNDGRDVGAEHMSQREENAVSMETDRVSMILESSPENTADQGTDNSHFDELVTAGNSKESHGDVVSVELPSMAEVSSEPDFIKDVPSSFSVTSSPGNHTNDLSNLGNSGLRGSSVAGTSKDPTGSRGGLEVSHDDEMQCTSGNSKKLQEPPEVAKFGDSQASQIKSLILEELEGSYVTRALPRAQSTSALEAGTYGKEKFSFVNESFLRSENGKIVDQPCETPIVKVEKAESEVQDGPCSHSEESVPDQDAACPEESDIASYNKNLSGHEESTMPDVFEVASKLIKRELDQEIEGSLDPAEVGNRTEGADGPVSSCKGGEAEENSETTGTEEGSAHGNQEDQTSSQTDASKVDAHGNITINEMDSVMRSGDEAIKDANDCPMRLTVDIKDEPFTFPEMCTGMQDLHQNAESAASVASNRSVPGVDKTEEVCKEAETELATEKSTTFEEQKSRVKKMERKSSAERISKTEQKYQQSHLDTSGSLPKSAERLTPISAEVPRKDAPGVQRTKERGSITNKEKEIVKDKETSQRLEEAKEREKILEKEKENAEDRERKKLEKQEREKEREREREREREKDKLAVERATREAHERAFAEARDKAEKMSFAARQRASVEAREKVQKDERANADARIKAERAAVERATAEARERAIEKARAEKAAAEARERRERYRSSSKESSKAPNLDTRPDTQFQRATSSGFVRNTDSRSKVVVEAESALRHKARIERHQRTTERVSKALAEKNMRDLMAQREQAEKHRLADFLDPEVKRWSNGKEGNLRALLSTLQYILGADSGWQPVPLTDLITAAAVKKAYRKATLCVHPDKLQQRGATIRQKYICEKVFDLLKDAWNKFTSEER